MRCPSCGEAVDDDILACPHCVELLAILGKGTASCVALSPDGKLVAVGSSIGIVLYEAETMRAVGRMMAGARVIGVVFSPDGQTLASGGEDNRVALWDSATGRLRTLEGHEGYVRSVAFSPDGRLLASGSDDKTVRLWDTETGLALRSLEGHEDYVRSVAFSPGSGTLASGSDDGTVMLWGVADRG